MPLKSNTQRYILSWFGFLANNFLLLFLKVSTSPVFVFPLQPDKCVRVVAYDTRYDSDVLSGGQGMHNALWLDNTFNNLLISVKREAKIRADWTSWEGKDFPYNDAYSFFTRLEESVDVGVHYLANAMTWVIQQVGTYECTLGVQDLKEAASMQIGLGLIFMLFSYLGICLIEFFMRSSDSVWLSVLFAAA